MSLKMGQRANIQASVLPGVQTCPMSPKMGHLAIFQASVLPGVRAPELLLNSEEIAKFTPEVGYRKPGRDGESYSSVAAPKEMRKPPRKERA